MVLAKCGIEYKIERFVCILSQKNFSFHRFSPVQESNATNIKEINLFNYVCCYEKIPQINKIEEFKLLKYSISKIAEKLNRSKSTISRELKTNRYAHYSYRAVEAQRKAFCRSMNRKSGKDKISLNKPLKDYIHEKLALRWSPDQIAVTLEKLYPNDKNMNVSHETIYLHTKKKLKNERIALL